MSISFDFVKLSQSNALLWQWAEYFEIENINFLPFAYTLPENFKQYYDKIKKAAEKKQFKKDFKVMFYAKEIENDLFNQYHPIILSSIKRFKIQAQESKEAAYDVGVSALRGAIWRYRMPSVKFLSYAMTGAIQSIRGTLSYRLTKMSHVKRRSVRIQMNVESGDSFADGKPLPKSKISEPWELVVDRVVLDQDNIAKIANLTPDETVLLQLRLNNQDYRTAFMEYYVEKHRVPCSKNTLYRVWNKIKIKIYLKLHDLRGKDALIYRESALCHTRR